MFLDLLNSEVILSISNGIKIITIPYQSNNEHNYCAKNCKEILVMKNAQALVEIWFKFTYTHDFLLFYLWNSVFFAAHFEHEWFDIHVTRHFARFKGRWVYNTPSVIQPPHIICWPCYHASSRVHDCHHVCPVITAYIAVAEQLKVNRQILLYSIYMLRVKIELTNIKFFGDVRTQLLARYKCMHFWLHACSKNKGCSRSVQHACT